MRATLTYSRQPFQPILDLPLSLQAIRMHRIVAIPSRYITTTSQFVADGSLEIESSYSSFACRGNAW